MTQFEAELADRLKRQTPDGEPALPATGVGREERQVETEPPVSEEPDLSQARSLLTELRPAGFGEVLVTEVWLPPPPREEADEDEAPADRQSEWEGRQELRQLGLLRERPLLSYDARTELYWNQAREARESAERAIVDPYTELAASFADADIEGIAAHRAEAREYGWKAGALLEIGRAYVAIGRLKSALGVFRAAAKADSQHPEAWWHLGVSRLFARANRAAVTALQRALDQMPGDFRAELALAVAQYHAKDYASAEAHFGRVAGATGLRAVARSMRACSLRMQENWEDARVELSFLRDAQPGDWAALAEQCLDCVERGEQKREGPLRARRRAKEMWQALAATAAGGVWIAYSVTRNLFREKAAWATIPLFVLAAVLARSLRGISGRELPGEFGNAEQGLPCWQATAWVRPRKSEF